MSTNFIFEIYRDKRTVFNLKEVALLVHEPDFVRLKQRLHYYVITNRLRNPRKGIYVKENYSPEELACKIYTPAYISLEYVLQKSGIIFQFSNHITIVSYLSRTIHVDEHILRYRKIKNEIFYYTDGISMYNNGISIASPERAFLDILYLNKIFYFDSLQGLNKEAVFNLLPAYKSNKLNKFVQNLFKNAGHQ